MKSSWNKGLTKKSNASVLKISATMRARKIDNFKVWREKMRRAGKIKSSYEPLVHSGDLAELIGVTLGDGHIRAFPRCEGLRIVGNSNNAGFANRYVSIIEKVFRKKPSIALRKNSNAFNISIYEKAIAKRLGVPAGSRHALDFRIPKWIKQSTPFLIRFLRGLYEAEGSRHFHAATYTHKIIFTNTNASLLAVVLESLTRLGFHPHQTKSAIQISRKAEVQKLADLLQFRRYER